MTDSRSQLDGAALPDEERVDETLRPRSLAEMVGQNRLRENLAVFIQAARERNESLDHLLFHGPPGLGKTLLAHVVAHEMGANLRVTSGPVIERAGDLAALLSNLESGDILFIEGTPIVWEGPIENWIRACRRIEAMDVDVVVPGHGPLTNPGGAAAVREYLAYVKEQARQRFDAGLSAADAARDIELGDYAGWNDSERIAVNVDTLYREFRGSGEPGNLMELFGLMGELARR